MLKPIYIIFYQPQFQLFKQYKHLPLLILQGFKNAYGYWETTFLNQKQTKQICKIS